MSKWGMKLTAALTAAGLLAGLALPAWAEEGDTVRQYETAQTVTSVEVNVENASLVIRKGTGSTVQVDSAADAIGEYLYDFDLENGVLTVKVEAGEGKQVMLASYGYGYGRQPQEYAVTWENEITITLPEAVYDKIEAVSHNGSMTVTGVEANEITLEGDNGWASLEGTRSRSTEIQLVNGSIEFDHSYALDYDCEVRNGGIRGILAGTKADYRLEASVEHGTCSLANQAGRGVASGSFQVTNGSINVTFTG